MPDPVAPVPAVSPSGTPVPGPRPDRGGFGAEAREAYLGLLRTGERRWAAARAIGFHPDTVAKARRKDPLFAAAMVDAEREALETVESELWLAATERKEPWAIQMLLKSLDRERWGDVKKVDIDVRVEIDAGEVGRRILELQRALAERVALESGEDVLELEEGEDGTFGVA